METKCKGCDGTEACVPFFLHENAMMHKDQDNKRMMVICLTVCVILVIVVVTLVSYYTTRTQMWNETIAQLTTTLAEISSGVH